MWSFISLRWLIIDSNPHSRAIYVIYCRSNRNILPVSCVLIPSVPCSTPTTTTTTTTTRYGGSYPIPITSPVVVATAEDTVLDRYVYINAISCWFFHRCPTTTTTRHLHRLLPSAKPLHRCPSTRVSLIHLLVHGSIQRAIGGSRGPEGG